MSDIQEQEHKNEILEMKRQEVTEMELLTKDIVDGANAANEKADEMYQYMSDLIEIDADKSPAAREMMGKAVELKLMSNMQKIEILKIRAKLLTPNSAGTNVNINLGDYDDKKGADTNNMIEIVEGIKRGRGAKIVNSDDFSDEE